MPSSLAAGADAALSGLIAERCARQVDSVEARFVAKKDFYYAWALQGRSATVQISDYLQGAPDVVLADFGEMVVRRALELDWEVPASFTDFVRTDGFVETRRPVFIRRSKNLLRTDAGEFRSIPDSVGRLMDAGLVLPSDVANSWFSWTRRYNHSRLGFCGTMFRVVGISSILDSPTVPDPVVDYVVYHECLHLRQGYRPDGRVHDAEMRAWEREFPGWRECEAELRKLGTMCRRRRQVYLPSGR